MEIFSSREYAEAYFAEEEEMKNGSHPSQIIPRATEELKSRGYDVDDIIMWDWHDNNGTVKIKFSDGEVLSYDYINNQIIENDSDDVNLSSYNKNFKDRHLLRKVRELYFEKLGLIPGNNLNTVSKHEYLMDWVHGLYNTPLNIHISEYNKLRPDDNILRDDVIVVKDTISLFMDAYYASCFPYKYVDHEALDKKLRSYMLKYKQICNYLRENV